MTIFDYVVLIIIGISIVISMMRGAVREILALLGWCAAFFVAKTYAAQLIPLLPADIPTAPLKTLAAFLILFLGVLLVASLLSIALSTLLKKIGLGWFNRLFGAVIGLARGLLIVSILVFLAGLTSLPKDVRWTSAMFSSPLETLVMKGLPYLPESIAKHVKYS
jgi:membrane protein required for colicin V production